MNKRKIDVDELSLDELSLDELSLGAEQFAFDLADGFCVDLLDALRVCGRCDGKWRRLRGF